MTDLVQHAKTFVESKVAELTGDEDFMPFLLLNCPAGHMYAGLLMPGEDDEKDKLADHMMALCATHRPSEVLFVSTTWTVIRKKGSDMDFSKKSMEAVFSDMDFSKKSISEQPDRMEAVFMVHHTDSTNKAATYSAAMTRRVDGAVVLSEWKHSPDSTVLGRFGRAITTGMKVAEGIPSEFGDWLDEEIEAGRAGDAMQSVLSALGKVRGVSTN